jgi:glucose-6-phosphate isomerase
MPGGFRRKRARDEQRVRVDGNGLMRGVIGEAGLADEDLAALGLRLDDRVASLERQRHSGFAVLPTAKGELRRTVQLADQVRGSFEDLVVLGSGDLALGIRALTSALAPLGRGADTAAPGVLRLHVADRPDPECFAALLARLDLRRTLFNVVSGSGDTLPTMSHFLIVRDRLLRELGAVAYQQHVVVTTAAGDGPLRQIVNDEGFRDLSLPSDVVDDRALLTAAALFPAACAGADVVDVVAGAADMADRCRNQGDRMSPAHLLATGRLLAGPRGVSVLTPVSTSLHDLATWIERRWGRGVPAEDALPDPRPVVLLLAVQQLRQELEIPKAYQDLESVGYLGGQGLGALAALQDEAAEMALWSAGRATIALRCPTITAFVLGQVVYLVDAADALARPTSAAAGPEAAAQLAYGLAGRPGYEAERAEVQRLAARREARYVV